MICHPNNEMIGELKKIWLHGFPHDEEYVELFFSHYFTPECCAVFCNEQEIESALYFFTAYINKDGKERPMLYFYAGVTLPKYEKKGNHTALAQFLIQEAKEKGYYGMAVSALPSTRNIYARENAHPAIFVNEWTMDANMDCCPHGHDLIVQDCSYEEFASRRHQYIDEQPGNIYWKKKELEYMFWDINDSGRVLLIGDKTGGRYYAAVTERDDCLLIRETDFPKTDCLRLMTAVVEYFNSHKTVKIQLGQDESADTSALIGPTQCYLASVAAFCGEKLPAHLYFNLLAIS